RQGDRRRTGRHSRERIPHRGEVQGRRAERAGRAGPRASAFLGSERQSIDGARESRREAVRGSQEVRRSARGRSFVAVGVSIGAVGQTTLEAVELMRTADKLFHCVVDPVVELWLEELNPSAESLNPLYEEGKERSETYAEMVDAFARSVKSGRSTCAAYYG